ncbi:MAG: phosphate/phosphite/phosphonate ABC transporter substrate-binding protein [Rubrivivax sp.]
MQRRHVLAGFGLAAAACAAPAWVRAQSARADGYRFSPVNQYGLQLTATYWNPLIEHVSAVSGVKLTLKIGRTSADTTSYVLAQEVDFAFTNHLFSPERERMGWKVLGRRDAPPVQGQLAVLDESPVHKLAQLADAEVGFPGPEAFVSYKVPYAHLLAEKVPVRVVFGGNMDSALTQLVNGKVAAVGGNSQLIEGFAKRESRRLRVLWSSEAFHELALMCSPRVPAADVDAVRRAFIGMAADAKGRAVLESASKAVALAKASGFVRASDSDYDNYRRFYASAPAQLR